MEKVKRSIEGQHSRRELISIQISTGNRASLGRHRDCFRSQAPMAGAPVCFLIKNLPGSCPESTVISCDNWRPRLVIAMQNARSILP